MFNSMKPSQNSRLGISQLILLQQDELPAPPGEIRSCTVGRPDVRTVDEAIGSVAFSAQSRDGIRVVIRAELSKRGTLTHIIVI